MKGAGLVFIDDDDDDFYVTVLSQSSSVMHSCPRTDCTEDFNSKMQINVAIDRKSVV